MDDCIQDVSHARWAEYLYDIAVKRDGDVPKPAWAHVRRCGSCRRQVARLKEAILAPRTASDEPRPLTSGEILDILDSHFRHVNVPVACSQAKPFLPGLASPSTDLRIPTPITVHVDHCPQCAADLLTLRQLALSDEQLRSLRRLYEEKSKRAGFWRRRVERSRIMPQIVYDIADRPDSDVTTVYHATAEDQTTTSTPGNPYGDHAIKVDVLRRPPSLFSRVRVAWHVVSCRHAVRRGLVSVLAAAAMLALAILFSRTHSASGVVLGDVATAFGQARNVRIVVFNPVSEEPLYELWVSRDLNLVGFWMDQKCVVYDLARREMEDIGSGQTSAIDDPSLANIRATMESCLGFSLAGVPADATWRCASDGDDRDVYELRWLKQTYAGRDLPVRYEIVVDRKTKLPSSCRMFQWDALEMEWECASVRVLHYLTAAEMEDAMGKPTAVGAESRL